MSSLSRRDAAGSAARPHADARSGVAANAAQAERHPMATATTYQLVIEVARPVRCAIGRLGAFTFPAGRYVYTGSARRNLEARIARHLRAHKTLHWHIDYLLAAPGVRIVAVIHSRRPECALNRAGRGRIVAPGFGASDCRAGCGAHLKHLGT
jgi:Uri superfamily endonuclease